MKHECPVPGCEARIHRSLLMCNAHWLAVPRAERATVNRAWRAYKQADREDQIEALRAYRDAREAAIRVVAESELPCLP